MMGRSAIPPRFAREGNRAKRGGGGCARHRRYRDTRGCTEQPTGVIDNRFRRSPSTALRAVPLPRTAGEDGRGGSILGASRA